MKKDNIIEFKKPTKKKKPVLDKEGKSFVARLPYPITIHTIVDIIERMGIEHEGTVLPGLKFIQRKITKLEMEKDDE
tara:strand:+ start:1202 stop:1432 length:231 start_codon:yes stop_codon:yes gene_type:complete